MTAAQMSIFDAPPVPRARRADPPTSHRAARDARGNATTNRRAAFNALMAAGDEGLTDFDLERITGVKQTSIGKRRFELVEAGLVVDSGEKRPAPSGSLAIVWKVVKGMPNREDAA